MLIVFAESFLIDGKTLTIQISDGIDLRDGRGCENAMVGDNTCAGGKK